VTIPWIGHFFYNTSWSREESSTGLIIIIWKVPLIPQARRSAAWSGAALVEGLDQVAAAFPRTRRCQRVLAEPKNTIVLRIFWIRSFGLGFEIFRSRRASAHARCA